MRDFWMPLNPLPKHQKIPAVGIMNIKVSQINLQGRYSKDCSILVSILRSPYVRELPYRHPENGMYHLGAFTMLGFVVALGGMGLLIVSLTLSHHILGCRF